MSDLIINNHIITDPIFDILKRVRAELTNGKLGQIQDKGEYVSVTCPFHKDGKESRSSCSVYDGDGQLEKGHYHCFTCGSSGSLAKFIGECFDRDESFGRAWLIENYGGTYLKPKYNLKDIILQKASKKSTDENILETFESYHPYMTKRRLSDEVIKRFEVKYDPKTNCIVFPVRDKYGKLSFLTRRSVSSKNFIIDKGVKKEVYLLYDILKTNPSTVYICESQINSLVCQSYGKPAVALFGCGCPDYQIEDLNNTGVKHYILALDPDQAGLKGTLKLCDSLRKDKFISVMILPKGKDIGDLTKEEFEACKIVDSEEFLKGIPDYYAE